MADTYQSLKEEIEAFERAIPGMDPEEIKTKRLEFVRRCSEWMRGLDQEMNEVVAALCDAGMGHVVKRIDSMHELAQQLRNA